MPRRQPEKAITKDLSDAGVSAHLFLFLFGSSVIHTSENGKGFVGFSLTEMSWEIAALAKKKKKKKLCRMTQTGAFTRTIEEMHGFFSTNGWTCNRKQHRNH